MEEAGLQPLVTNWGQNYSLVLHEHPKSLSDAVIWCFQDVQALIAARRGSPVFDTSDETKPEKVVLAGMVSRF